METKRYCLAFLFLVFLPSLPASQNEADVLPSTRPLQVQGDLAAQMVAGIDRYLMREIELSPQARRSRWQSNFSSQDAYEKSVEPNRERFRKIIGAVNERVATRALEYVATTSSPARIAESEKYFVYSVRWPVLQGVDGEGLLFQPKGKIRARIVVIPDADQTPEMLGGLAPGIPRQSQFARSLAEDGCQVVVPVLINRDFTWSGNSAVGLLTNQPHREWIYRQAFQLGRHVIGFEVEKILALVDWFSQENSRADISANSKIGLAGYGEGGLIAFYTAALDRRVDAVLVSGYFDSRQQVWQEPIYRNVFGLLGEFGDAEIAGLIAPRALIIEHSEVPGTDGPPTVPEGRRDTAAPGKLSTPPYESVRREFERAKKLFPEDGRVRPDMQLIAGESGKTTGPGFRAASGQFLKQLKVTVLERKMAPSVSRPKQSTDRIGERQRRQVKQLEEYCQRLMEGSEQTREQFWKETKPVSIEAWISAIQGMKEFYREEIVGRFPPPSPAMNARSRMKYDQPKWKGYEVVLDLWPDVFSYGILLVPNNLKPGERRPVVVCQHGLEGRPEDVVNPDEDTRFYHSFGARLADRGFVVFAPQNPYTGKTSFRMLNRKANPLKKTFFGVIVRQHQQILEWLAQLSFVDPSRIGFYGLSYGGVSAMRLPALLDGYSLSICAANFNDWVRKIGTTRGSYSYLFHGEFEMFGEFGVANYFNYAELAGIIAPRPFMVERGHNDTAGRDEMVAYEYAKVRRLYALLGIPERTAIEFFPGGHEIHGKGTFEFLHRHLKWPSP